MFSIVVVALNALLPASAEMVIADIPFATSLTRSDIRQQRLDDVLEHGLILGNGDINALVYSSGSGIIISLTKNDVWDARLLTENDPPLPTIKRLKQLVAGNWPKEDDKEWILPENQTFDGQDSYHAYPFPCPLQCAEVVLDFGLDEHDGNLTSCLSLEKAVVSIDGVPDKTHGVTVRALAQRNVFLIESEAPARLRAVTPPFLPPAKTESGKGIDCIVQDVPGDLDWPGMLYAVAMARQNARTAVSIVTSLESENPREAAIKLAVETLEKADDTCIKEHEDIWRGYWSASGVLMDDAVLEQNWYRSLYFLRCVTKPGAVSPGLFAGLINATPAWHGDYHLNYNLQQTFWSAYVTNHCDLAEPYDRLIRDYVIRGQWLARQVYECEGAFYPHVLYAYEPEDPATCKSVNGRQYVHHVWGLTLGVAGFAVQPLWWRYKYAPDPEMLRTVTYPPLREVARFYACFVRACERKDGVVLLGPTVSPEHWGWTKNLERNYDCTFDIAMARYTLEAAIEAAQVLDTDAELVKQWRETLGVLPPYPVTGGDSPVVVDVAGAPPINYNIAVPATPVYPGDMVTWWSDEAEKALFARTIDSLEWNGNNSTFMLAISRARLSMAASDAWLRDEITARQRPNGTLTLNRLGHRFNAFGHYTEQFGAAQAISELLLQSVGDIVRVLPAWPLDTRVRFHQLRTQGGFLVSGGCEGGRILPLEIQSTVGGTLRLAAPWKDVDVRCGNEKRGTRDDNGIITVRTHQGDVLLISEATASKEPR